MPTKLTIVGAGHVGATTAFSVVMRELFDSIVLVNRSRRRAEGEAADLRHAAAFVSRSMDIAAGEIADSAGSDVIVLTLSSPVADPAPSRLALAPGNIELFRSWIPPLAEASPDAVLVVVTNPVDVMSYVTWQLAGFPPSRVIGTGTLIDSARFRSLLSAHLKIHPDDIRAYVLGEHGESQFPALSVAATGGQFIDRDPMIESLFEQTRDAGREVLLSKGHTNFGIALATTMILEAVIRDSHRTLPVSTLIKGYQGVRDVFLSVPCIVGAGGVQRALFPELTNDEGDRFRNSAQLIQETLNACWRV